ncbi:MAG: phosphoribosyl-ATP diphosphatase [Pseudomonadota bacterium]
MSDTISRLERTIRERFKADPGTSYVASLHARGEDVVARKVGEEAIELVVAHLAGTREEQVKESADLMFHLLIQLAEQGIGFDEVLAELDRRDGVSGLDEKASRPKG